MDYVGDFRSLDFIVTQLGSHWSVLSREERHDLLITYINPIKTHVENKP